MGFVGTLIESCMNQAERELKEEREFQLLLASIPRTINVNINTNTNNMIVPIIVDSLLD